MPLAQVPLLPQSCDSNPGYSQSGYSQSYSLCVTIVSLLSLYLSFSLFHFPFLFLSLDYPLIFLLLSFLLLESFTLSVHFPYHRLFTVVVWIGHGRLSSIIYPLNDRTHVWKRCFFLWSSSSNLLSSELDCQIFFSDGISLTRSCHLWQMQGLNCNMSRSPAFVVCLAVSRHGWPSVSVCVVSPRTNTVT